MSTSDSRLIHLSWWRDWRRPLSISSDWELIVLHFYVWSQSLHPRPTVLTFEASYYIWGQLLLHLEPVNTFQVNCYYIWSQLLHLTPTVITYGASYYTWGQLLHLWPQQLLTDGQTDGITDLRTVPTKYKGFCARLRPRGKRRSLQGQQESAKKNGPRIFSR